ncbi:neprilysin-2-like [Stegodyphus dumicola]|uniref:neprilysin-2-like n=1 Tax=Stegodyphus dumicola TaxID=202533 RepID=UPI0015A7978F|nr:neprilysin-2-like [Stegodyphus dumicola]
MGTAMEIFCQLLLSYYSGPELYLPAGSKCQQLNMTAPDCLESVCSKPDMMESINKPVAIFHVLNLLNISTDAYNCLTPECVKAAANILSNLDATEKPCNDFYQFACGGWLNKHAIPEGKYLISVVSELQDGINRKLRSLLEEESVEDEPYFIQMIKRFYYSCMDLERIQQKGSEPLKKVLKDLGGWPVVEGENWNETSFEWIDSIEQMSKKGYNHNILMGLSILPDDKNNTIQIIKLDQAALEIPGLTYLMQGLNDSSVAAYFKMMIKAANKLGANASTLEDELKETLNFEIMLANFSLPPEKRRNMTNMYNKYTVQELIEHSPQIDWLKYFNRLLSVEIDQNETLVVNAPQFVKKFADFINKTEKRVVANYMMWKVVQESFLLLSEDWRNLFQEFYAVIAGQTKKESRWEQCISSVKKDLELATNVYYALHYPDVENEGYFSAATFQIGVPKVFLNNTYVLDDVYRNLLLNNENYFDNALEAHRWSTQFSFSRLRIPFVKGQGMQHIRAAEANAFYNFYQNSIEFNTGILQYPLFDKDLPYYLNLGAFGSMIGHEIMHGFDDEGRQYDKNGNYVNWWSRESDELFLEKARCIIEQYGNYTVEDGIQVNGVNTQGENIADNGGLKAAYWAFRTRSLFGGTGPMLPGLKYTPNQLFWISAAQVYCSKITPEFEKFNIMAGSHTPQKFRVIGTMSNLPEFSEDFQCEPDSAMNRKTKCRVW